jgi:hypothetical protein
MTVYEFQSEGPDVWESIKKSENVVYVSIRDLLDLQALERAGYMRRALS